MTSRTLATQNAQGLQSRGGWARFVSEACKYARANAEVDTWLVQEHNLNPTDAIAHRAIAAARGMEAIIGYAEEGENGVHWGGTLVLVNERTVTVKSVICATGGLTVVVTERNGESIKVASVYAPVKPVQRIDFIHQELRKYIDKDTYAGGDWNCVPDPTLDVQASNIQSYTRKNQGAKLLADIMKDCECFDIRREQLGNEREYTRAGVNRNSDIIATRLDRWYVPTTEEERGKLWTIYVKEDFIWKKKSSDHKLVILEQTTQEGERGRDRQTIDESLAWDERIQGRIANIVHKAYKGTSSEEDKWTRAIQKMRNYLLDETNRRKKKRRTEAKAQRIQLKVIARRLTRAPNKRLFELEKELKTEIYELEHPEIEIPITESRATQMTHRSDACTKAFFQSYKTIGKQQWINGIKTAIWREEGPTFKTINGKEECAPDKVSTELTKYYRMLYAPKVTDPHERELVMKMFRKRRISKKTKEIMDAPLTIEEIIEVMENLPLGKQAGPDRIPNGIFKCMSTIFAPRLFDLLTEAIANEKMPDILMEGEISVMYKKKERNDPRNYRPLTMLQNAYKIYTRVIARRMKTMVHTFVDNCQKGFVPDTFIADATMLLQLIEQYINDDDDERKGIMIFCDMEKAFDRVSFTFLRESMKALGFGKYFCNMVGILYDEDNAPRRRIYANGYYGPWFRIQSGVAQGCPLSPLLFLLVGQALKDLLDSENRIQGIEIKGRRYKISQYADDTTLLLRDVREMRIAFKILERWGRATGMKENSAKREGLAMGSYRYVKMPSNCGVKWAEEGGWVIALGVPIGNDLDPENFWKAKLDVIRSRSKRWLGLYRSSYYGRLLIAQAMYLGCLRYWLYSLLMSKRTIAEVQSDTDRILFAKDPSVFADTRYRRFVAKLTAIGPRSKGGLNAIDWKCHVEAFKAQWAMKYLHPYKSDWKELLDSLIIYDKKGREKFPEGRAILMSKLSNTDKKNVLKDLPKGSIYWRECIKAHWNMKITQDTSKVDKYVGREPLWRNWRYDASDHLTRRFFEKIGVYNLEHIMVGHSRKIRTAAQWRKRIDERYERRYGVMPDIRFTNKKVRDIMEIIEKIPANVKEALGEQHACYIRHLRTDGNLYALTEKGQHTEYGRWKQRKGKFAIMEVDDVGKLHKTGRMREFSSKTPIEVETWDGRKEDFFGRDKVGLDERVIGPKSTTFPMIEGWKMDGTAVRLDRLTIKAYTETLKLRKFKPPAAEKSWPRRLNLNPDEISFKKTWKIKSFFVTARDRLQWTKVWHRTLYTVGKDTSAESNSCIACNDTENILHLATCHIIRLEFWGIILDLLARLGQKAPEDETAFIILGRIDTDTTIDENLAGIMFLAWRCLYAEITRARIERDNPDMGVALTRTGAMCVTRLMTYGAFWRKWSKQRILTNRGHITALSLRERRVFKMNSIGEYEVHEEIMKLAKHNHEN
tara:strand:+ start:2316 stop:6662 length:4347 start_codon:yes stop_codon:yes gene_type:complete